MADLLVGDSKAQLKAIVAAKGDALALYGALTNLSISLVIGVEHYLRRFDTVQSMPLLVNVLERYVLDSSAGDLMVMTFRSVSLILEHVPSSYDGAQEFHKPLMKLGFQTIHRALCKEWIHAQTDTESLYEECLRTVRFVGKDDRTGVILKHAFVGDLLTLCASENSLLARQGLETLCMLCSKVVMPSELEKRSQPNAFLSLFKSKKKGSKGYDKSAAGGDDGDNPIVVNVENVIAPFLQQLVEQFTVSLPHAPDTWTHLELSIQCLGTLMERALLCHRPRTAQLLVPAELPTLLFRIIAAIDNNVTLDAAVRNERTLVIESMLAIITSCHRGALADSLLTREAKQFFHGVLEESSGEITTLLDQPFPLGLMAARSTQRRDKNHITSIAAIRLLVLATPSVPPEAFGLKPKIVLPVHQWMWEDELRHANRLVEEQCVSLETSWTRLSKNSAVVVHTKALPADLQTMTMARGFAGGFRNISRCFVPFVYHFVDEGSVRPVAAVKQAGPDPVTPPLFASPGSILSLDGSPSHHHHHNLGSATASSAASPSGMRLARNPSSSGTRTKQVSFSFSATDRQVMMNERDLVPESHMAIAEEYFIQLCEYATYASGQMAKQLATCACASILQMMFLTNADARVVRLMQRAMLPMCEMFRAALIATDKATKAVVLTMTEWLLRHSMAAGWKFCDTAERCGYASLLEETSKVTPVVAVTRDAKPTRTADLADRSGELFREITARVKKERGTSSGIAADTARLQCATQALRAVAAEPGTHEKVLREFFEAVGQSNSVTAYEAHQMELASAALSYLLGGTTTADLLGPAVVFTSGASGSTSARASASPVDFGGTGDTTVAPGVALVAGGVRMGDLLHLHLVQQRLMCLVDLVTHAPQTLQQLVGHLVGSLTLQSTFPLVESIITHEPVVCKTPLHAFQALSDISPRVVLCGSAGKVASPAYVADGSLPEDGYVTREQSGITMTDGTMGTNTACGVGDAGAGCAAASSGGQQALSGPKAGSIDGGPSLSTAPPLAPPSQHPKDYCMRGHRLKEMTAYVAPCVCDFCGAGMKSGYACRVCNFDLCRNCHSRYKGNVTLLLMMQSPHSIPRNRANLVSSIGDIERYFRTGSTSTKGTQLAPTSQSSLQHFDRFGTRAKLTLTRKTTDGGEPKHVVDVAKLLLQHPALLQKALYTVLQGFYTRGTLPAADASSADERSAAVATSSLPPTLTPAQAKVAEELVAEALEDRYVLYRPTSGRCAYQETFLAHIYQQAFTLGNRQVLLQLENCLLRQEGSTEPLTLQPSTLPSPLATASSVRNRSMATDPAAAASASVRSGSISHSGDPREEEFSENRVGPQQSFVFHHFESDSASRCSCGQHSRISFATKETDNIAPAIADFARRPDMLLLILLHRSFYSPSHAVLEAGEIRHVLDETVFVNSVTTTAVVKCLEASALRVAILPAPFALPRWCSFVLAEARFLVPRRARERISRYLAYGARRSFILYMRLFRQYRLDRTVSIAPGEWARMSNHKFTVDRAKFLRDAYTVLRKCSDARLPISFEFAGDVGVGQGPTAQFYTLLAQEVSKARLGLWRNTTAAAAADGGRQTLSTAKKAAAPAASATTWSNNDAAAHHVQAVTRHPTAITGGATGAAAEDVLVDPPPEGFFPTRTADDGSAALKGATVAATGTPKRGPTMSGASSINNSSRRFSSPPAAPSPPPRVSGRLVLTDHRAVLKDYVQAQRDRAMAFYAVGAALGRAFVDEQVLPIPLCHALSVFLRRGLPPAQIILDASTRMGKGAETPVDLLGLPMRAARLVDPEVANSIESLSKMDPDTLASLEMPFTLPGEDDFELIPGGARVLVTAQNLKRYQRRVLNALLYDAVAFPLRMLTMGCHDVVPREALAVLEVDELMKLLCGEEKSASEPLWTGEEITSVLVGDHGYQNDSPQLEMLASILAKRLTPAEQRAFLLFCTGCPRLPVGGIRALGAITVVKRSNAFAQARVRAAQGARLLHGADEEEDPEEDGDPLFTGGATATLTSNHEGSSTLNAHGSEQSGPDDVPTRPLFSVQRTTGVPAGSSEAACPAFELPDSEWALPSVNTCFKYLKLPPYPTEELMYRKLMLSITQCGNTFELS